MPFYVLCVNWSHNIWGFLVSLITCVSSKPTGKGTPLAGQIIHVLSELPAATENQAEDGTNVALCLLMCLLVLMQLDREGNGARQDLRDSFSNVTKLKIAFGSVADMEPFIQIRFFLSSHD